MSSIVYPLTIEKGTISTLEEELDYPTIIKQAVVQALSTELEERPMFLDYGLDDVIHSSMNNPSEYLSRIEECLGIGLASYPGLTYSVTGFIEDDGGALMVLIFYNIDSERFKLGFKIEP